MRKIVRCKLVINSNIEGKENKNIIEGKGYYRDDNEEIIVYFSNEDSKYKYEYKDNVLIVHFNDSCYRFKLNKEEIGEIKNGDYIFKITTLASIIEIKNNCINLNYMIKQNNKLIGSYKTSLSFE